MKTMGQNEVSGEVKTAPENGAKQLADYGLIFDLFSTIAGSRDEEDVVDDIINVYNAIFAPAHIAYLPYYGELRGFLKCRPHLPEHETSIAQKLAGFDKEYGLTDSGKGFTLKISHGGEKLGVIEIDGITFPEYLKHYLNLAINSASVFGLAISNARNYQALEKKNKDITNSEQRFRQLSEASFEGISIGIEGKVVDCNSALARMFGYAPNEIIGKTTLDLISPESQAVVIEHFSKGIEDSYEAVGVKKDGSMFPIETRGLNITYRDQKARVTAIRDNTERKKAEEKLKAAKEAAEEATLLKDKFVALVSHDLKNPLYVILGFLKMMREPTQVAGDGNSLNMIDTMMIAARNMLNLIEDVLTSTRFNTGKIKLKRKFFNPHALAAGAMAQFGIIAEQKDLRIINEIPEKIRAYGDPDLLLEVFKNLLSNAVKFTKRGGSITMLVPRNMENVLAVADTGVGIARERIEGIFKYEEKTSTSGTAGEIGTGFGIPLSNDIVMAHGGSITVESEPGKGTIFYVNLPLVRPLVLLVDDDSRERLLFAHYLAKMDVDIIEAEDGRSALALMKQRTPHLVITDLNMPFMDGFELMGKIKHSPETDFIPVIVITSDKQISTREKAFRLGADDFINKDQGADDFLPRITRFLG